MRKHLGRPSPAMITSLIALFVSLGGVGYAAATIGTNDIQNGAVTNKKLAEAAVSVNKLRRGAVRSAKIADAQVTAPKLANITVNSTGDINLPTGESRAGTATCPAGEVAISGGLHFNGANNADHEIGVVHSYRFGNAWLARAFNNSGAQQTFQVYAFCLAR